MDVLKDALTLLDETRTRSPVRAGSFQRFLPKDIPFCRGRPARLEVSHPAASSPAPFKSLKSLRVICLIAGSHSFSV